jgi:branched-chain amino acid transport system substrate-binding protein
VPRGRDHVYSTGGGFGLALPSNKRSRWKVLALVVASVLAGAACGSSKSTPDASRAPTGSAPVITVGVLTDISGIGGNPTVVKGIEAGIGVAASEGYKIRYVVGDTQSSPTGALTAAQKLVEQDHVFAVVAISGLTFAAAPFLSAHHVPVVGVAEDSTEWITSRNMFSVIGTEDYSKVISTYGEFFKRVGATRIGTLGFSIAPSAKEAAKAAAVSAEAAGLTAPYVNPEFPFGSTNVGPAAIAMKNASVDGLTTALTPNINYLLLTALKQQGATLKGALLPTGYGGDLESAGAPARQAAQGVYFLTGQEPIEMHTPATERLQSAFQKYAGVTGDPTFSEYWGYESIDGVVTGLKAAGGHPSQESFMKAMLSIRSYNPGGLYGNQSIGFAMDQRGKAAGVNNCFWITQYVGSTFHLVPGMDPLCGSIIPGKTVSAS